MLKHRNHELAVVLKNDPRRLRIKRVETEKKKLATNRSRSKTALKKESVE